MHHLKAKSVILTIVGCAIVIGLLLSELIARAIHPVSTVEYRVDEEIGQVLVPNQRTRWVSRDYDVIIRTNSAGFHDVEHVIAKKPGVYRVVVLGDSFMEALQVPIENGFARQLQMMMQEWTGRSVEVINLGISGTGPSQYYRVLNVVGLKYHPDLVLMAILPGNDFRDSHPLLSGAVTKPYYTLRENGKFAYMPPQPSEISRRLTPWLRRSALLNVVRRAIARTSVETWFAQLGLLAPAAGQLPAKAKAAIPRDWYVYVADPPDPWPEAYTLTLRMIEESQFVASEAGARFLVMLIGSVPTIEDRWEEALAAYPAAEQLTWDMDRPYREVAKLAEQRGFEVVNLIDPFRHAFRRTGRSLSWPHDGHWNARGHRLAAKVVSSFLRAHRGVYGLE